MTMPSDELGARKNEIRKAAHAARKEQADREGVSRRITDRVTHLEEYVRAELRDVVCRRSR